MLMGCRNRPNPARAPKEIQRMMQPQASTSPGFMDASLTGRVACRTGTLRMKKTQSGSKLLHLRQVGGEDRLAQRLDRLGTRKAAAPGEADAPRRRRARERQ